MFTGGNTTLDVADLSRSLRFFVEVLGFKCRAKSGVAWAEVEGGEGLVLGLRKASEKNTTRLGGIAIGLDVNIPIEEAMAVLDNRGVAFDGPIVDGAIGRMAYFSDPDGHRFYLVEHKG